MEAKAYSRGELIIMTSGIINDALICDMGFELSPQYTHEQAIKMLRRMLLVESFKELCLQYKCTAKYIKLIERNGRDYVCVSWGAFTKLSGLLSMALLFLKNTNAYPYLILDDGDTYIGLEVVDTLNKRPFPIESISSKIAESCQTYIMYDEATGLYKIGRSKNISTREATLAGAIPLIKTILTHTENFEAALHKEYAAKRIRGEWFSLNKIDLRQIVAKYGFKRANN